MTTSAKKKKAAMFFGLGALGLVLLTTSKPAKAKGASVSPPADDDDDSNAIDLDAIPDEPEAQSPGWPSGQPTSSPTLPSTPPGPPPLGQLPSLPTSLPTSIPTSIPANIPLPQMPDELPPIPANVPVPSIPVPARPPAATAEEPVTVPQDTATMVQRLLSQEAGPNWKTRDPVVKAWQASRGLVADGEFGVKSALRTADEIGVIPLIRFWPKGSYPEGKWITDYQAALITKANASPEPKRSQLLASADREKGQGFGRNPAAQQKVVTLTPAPSPASKNFEGPNV